MMTPHLIVLAGPNGAGKTTAASRLIPEGFGNPIIVDADVIARGLGGFSPEQVGFSAGRIMISRLDERMASGKDFLVQQVRRAAS